MQSTLISRAAGEAETNEMDGMRGAIVQMVLDKGVERHSDGSWDRNSSPLILQSLRLINPQHLRPQIHVSPFAPLSACNSPLEEGSFLNPGFSA